MSESVVLAWEIGFRKTFTDYIDDVSTFYVDKTVLQNAKGPVAVELAYRANELKGGDQTYPVSAPNEAVLNTMISITTLVYG